MCGALSEWIPHSFLFAGWPHTTRTDSSRIPLLTQRNSLSITGGDVGDAPPKVTSEDVLVTAYSLLQCLSEKTGAIAATLFQVPCTPALFSADPRHLRRGEDAWQPPALPCGWLLGENNDFLHAAPYAFQCFLRSVPEIGQVLNQEPAGTSAPPPATPTPVRDGVVPGSSPLSLAGCGSSSKCEIRCTEEACDEAKIDCGPSSDCLIECTGKEACKDVVITPENQGGVIRVLCDGDQSCQRHEGKGRRDGDTQNKEYDCKGDNPCTILPQGATCYGKKEDDHTSWE
eukprot:gene57199-biopygen65670